MNEIFTQSEDDVEAKLLRWNDNLLYSPLNGPSLLKDESSHIACLNRRMHRGGAEHLEREEV